MNLNQYKYHLYGELLNLVKFMLICGHITHMVTIFILKSPFIIIFIYKISFECTSECTVLAAYTLACR